MLFALLLIFHPLISQTLVDNTKRWNTVLTTESAIDACSEIIRLGSDTSVDAEIYKKVLRSTDEQASNCSDYGLIREIQDTFPT
jgi:hypothetical protein